MRKAAKRARSTSPPTAAAGAFWLMKSEPYKFSIDDLKGMTTSPWDGVRNYEARNNMKAMKVGDKVLFYHSMAKETGVVGQAEVCKLAYDDHTALDTKSEYHDPKATKEKNPWQMVDVKFVEKFPRVVSLEEMKKEDALSNMVLIKRGRLSVQPVTPEEYAHVLRMSKKAVAEASSTAEKPKKKAKR